jgi:hypothetical protein
MTCKITDLTIYCTEPHVLTRFWSSVLDYEVQHGLPGLIRIGPPKVLEGTNRPGPVPPTLTFEHVPEGKTSKNRLHLELNPTDREQKAEVRRLLGLGARLVDDGQIRDVNRPVMMADPEGNEFSVLAYIRP